MKKLVSIIFLGAILIACGPEKPKEKTDGEDSYESIPVNQTCRC